MLALYENVEVLGVDHPFSGGWSLRLSTFDHLPVGPFEDFCGHDQQSKQDFIYLQRDVSGLRAVEPIVHETSNLLDAWFDRLGFVPCTETRAYCHDWVVGKCLHVLDLTIETVSNEGDFHE